MDAEHNPHNPAPTDGNRPPPATSQSNGDLSQITASVDKFDEYKFFATSTEHLSERRQATTQTYLSVNAAILGAMTFLIQYGKLAGWQLVLSALPVFLVGGLACWIWIRIIGQYQALIGWRYGQLMEMERNLADSHQMYVKEWKDFFEPRQDRRGFGFSRLEARLPRLFILLYGIYAVGLLGLALTS